MKTAHGRRVFWIKLVLDFARDFEFGLQPLFLLFHCKQPFQIAGHLVEGFGEFAQLIFLATGYAMSEVAPNNASCAFVKLIYCMRQAAGEPYANNNGDNLDNQKQNGNGKEELKESASKRFGFPENRAEYGRRARVDGENGIERLVWLIKMGMIYVGGPQ